MIVNYVESGWQIVTQRSHGLLAAQICAHWKKDKQPIRWVDTLIAAAEHDDVYNEFENNDLLNDLGGPVNFKETEFRGDYANRLIAMAETKSAYVALLLSRHVQFVHGNNPEATGFITKLKKREKDWLKISGATVSDVGSAYELLEFSDAFSLLICQQLVQPERRKIEISKGPDGKAYEMFTNKNGICVSPWPFDVESFMVTWESRTILQLTFSNLEEFREAIKKTDVTTHQLTLSKGKR